MEAHFEAHVRTCWIEFLSLFECVSSLPPVLHDVASYEGSGAAQAGLAVYGHGPLRPLANFQKLLQDVVRRRRAVRKKEVAVVEAIPGKPLGVVNLPVQTDDGRYLQRIKNKKK